MFEGQLRRCSLGVAWRLGLLIVGAASLRAEGPLASPTGRTPVRLEFFFHAGCEECQRVRQEVLPMLKLRFGELFILQERDLGQIENYRRLVQAMDRLGVQRNAPVWLLIGDRCLLGGVEEIADQAETALEAAFAEPPEHDTAHSSDKLPSAADRDWLAERLRRFAVANVVVAGLVDGLNPCAISSLVFLASVLSLSRVRGLHLIAVGSVFVLATFLTYAAIGFGLLEAVYRLTLFRRFQKAVDWGLIAALVVMSALSFRDAARFRQTGSPSSVTLKLPPVLSQRVHRLLRAGLSRRGQLITVFVVGCLVTALESVCTGQVYVPTLVWVVRTGTDRTRGLAYLGLYNLMFVLPLIAVLGLVYAGLEWLKLAEWSRRNVVASKVAMGVFFLGLAATLAMMT